MITALANHVWQSTLIAAAAGLLTLAFRAHRAEVRYSLWLAASAKFLVPFAALTAIGRAAGWRAAPAVRPGLALAVDAIGQPFGSIVASGLVPARASGGITPTTAILSLWACGSMAIVAMWCVRWRRVSTAVRDAAPITSGRELDALRRVERRLGVRTRTALASSSTSLEPGVFGIVKPTLLWPRGIGEHLDEGQVEAIMAHEICHVRRRDNLAAALHMLVEAAFWFHPLVWWLGARLVDERERACDEDVVRLGIEPQTYAEGILKTCEFYVGSPLDCVAGVTGSDLKQRIERIMKHEARTVLTGGRKLLLTAAGAAAILGPVAFGVVNTPRLRAQSSEDVIGPRFLSATITPSAPDDPKFYPATTAPDGTFTAKNVMLRNVIMSNYAIEGARVVGGPDWLRTDHFDIEAKAAGHPSNADLRSMMRRLLADRFQLSVHHETRQQLVYSMVLVNKDGTPGPKLRPSTPECIAAADAMHAGKPLPPSMMQPRSTPAPYNELPCGAVASRPGTMYARAAKMDDLARGGFGPLLGRMVLNRTGLSGYFDLDLAYKPDEPTTPPPPPVPGYGRPAPFIGPAYFTAIEEQLGISLASETAPVDFLVIDRVEKPTPQ